MNDREKAIVMAFTGWTTLEGDRLKAFYDYLSEKAGRPVYTHEFAFITDVMCRQEIKADFIALCKAEEMQPVAHAYWYGSEFDGYADGSPVYDTWGCSNCHEEVHSEGFPPVYDYCPHCGAKMDGEPPASEEGEP